MTRSGEEIQLALRDFVTRWSGYVGSEKAEAQTFLNELFVCYGSDRRAVGAEFEFYIPQAGGFMDLHWPEVCLIEMKRPSVPVETAQQQIERYWRASSDPDVDRAAARWIVVCNFGRFEIWEPGRFPTRPRLTFDLADLPDRYDALAFLAGPAVEPTFTEHYRELTQDAARIVAGVYHSLIERSAAPGPELQRFVLQSVWCMFAEDLGMLDGYPYQTTLADLRSQPERSAADLSHLFNVLNMKGKHHRVGRLAGTRYVNGDLFARPAQVGLDRREIDLMLEATAFDWRKVDPTIFGSLLEGVLGKERRWEIGAHYTHEVDIMKIVGPTVVRPWREQIEETTTPAQARAVLEKLCSFKVLDPACGCGNFLYVAYRELRALEAELKARIRRLAEDTGLPVPAGPEPYFPLTNLQGIDIEDRAVQVARVTLWMGHRQMIDRFGEAEPALPLQSLAGIKKADALKTPWPETDCIIGNPPFQGSQHLRASLGDDYVDWLKREFKVGVKDLCTYWFRVASDHMESGQRAGLVGTNSISQNRGRSVSLDYVVEMGGVLTDAISSQVWPGDAKVHVSIVNWVHKPEEPPKGMSLNGIPVVCIRPNLTSSTAEAWAPQSVPANRLHCFQGPIPVGGGFIVSDDEAREMLCDEVVDYRSVVRPYLTSSDIAERVGSRPSRWIIDFGQRPLQGATNFPIAIRIVTARVRPFRESVNREGHRLRWWLFGEPRVGMRIALSSLPRYIAGGRHGKRLVVSWVDSWTMASDATNVFAFDDDYSMGLLLSRPHTAWAWAQSSTLKGDLRYTPTSVFMTFAWPDPATDVQRERVAEASRRLLARRSEICLAEQIGLTKLYNAIDDGAWADLTVLHRDLDEAVAACYGWPKAVAQDDREIVARLTELNRQISEGERDYAPFA